MKITKAIIPAAGRGTRLLPLSKAIPKEMMPILDKPALQYSIEEATLAGITEFIIIMNDDKKPYVQSYFNDTPYTITFKPQPEPLGLGHAVLMGKDNINIDEYIAVMLPDDIIDSTTACLAQLITIAQHYNASVIAVEKVNHEQTASYGIIAPKTYHTDSVIEIATLVEKPNPDQAPSHFGIIGRYILPYRIFNAIEAIAPHANGEIQLTDAIAYLLRHGERVMACVIEGTRYDIGSPAGLFNATVSLGAKRELYNKIILRCAQENFIFLKENIDNENIKNLLP